MDNQSGAQQAITAYARKTKAPQHSAQPAKLVSSNTSSQPEPVEHASQKAIDLKESATQYLSAATSEKAAAAAATHNAVQQSYKAQEPPELGALRVMLAGIDSMLNVRSASETKRSGLEKQRQALLTRMQELGADA